MSLNNMHCDLAVTYQAVPTRGVGHIKCLLLKIEALGALQQVAGAPARL